MNLMFFSDPHIRESDFEELDLIFSEILTLKKSYQIDQVIIPGDTFDTIAPTSKELDFFSSFIKKLNCSIILIAADSHESTTPEDSIVNHFGILKENITVVKEYHDENNLFVGHFIVNEATKILGGTKSKEDLKQYKNVVLGHSHIFEVIKPNICQLGSVRFISFNEDPNIKKRVAVCLDYGTSKAKWGFPELKNPYPLKDIYLEENKESVATKYSKTTEKVAKKALSQVNPRLKMTSVKDLCSYLDSLDSKTKVRIVYQDYNLWRSFLPLEQKYKEKFVVFRQKKDFVISLNETTKKTDSKKLKESLIEWLKANKIEERIQIILLEKIKC